MSPRNQWCIIDGDMQTSKYDTNNLQNITKELLLNTVDVSFGIKPYTDDYMIQHWIPITCYITICMNQMINAYFEALTMI